MLQTNSFHIVLRSQTSGDAFRCVCSHIPKLLQFNSFPFNFTTYFPAQSTSPHLSPSNTLTPIHNFTTSSPVQSRSRLRSRSSERDQDRDRERSRSWGPHLLFFLVVLSLFSLAPCAIYFGGHLDVGKYTCRHTYKRTYMHACIHT